MENSVYNKALNPRRKLEAIRPGERLESWKEIAHYLSRSVRTVRRWEENEGLPVHRLQHTKRGSVYAFRAELDSWRESRAPLLADEHQTPEPATGDWQLGWRVAAVLLVIATVTIYAVSRQSRASANVYTPSPEALRAFQRARFGLNAGCTQVQSGIKNYQEAIRLDPYFARAWTGLASAHIALTWFGDLPARETMEQARMEAQKALSLDASLGGPWSVLAYTSHNLDWDHTTAERSFRKALELSPRGSVPASWFAEFLLDMRRYDEASMYAKQAQDSEPRWLGAITVTGNIHLFMGNPDMAIIEYKRALEIEPTYGLGNQFLGRAYLAQGHREKAVKQLRKSNDLLGQVPFSMADLGFALATSGQRGEAQKMLADMLHKREAGYYPAFAIGEIHLGLGKSEEALDWMERAVGEGNMGYYFPSVDSIYAPLHAHPRFRALMNRIRIGTFE